MPDMLNTLKYIRYVSMINQTNFKRMTKCFWTQKDMHVLYKNDNDMCKSNSSGSSNKSEYLMQMFIYQQHYL